MSEQRPWLQHYPKGIPANIDPDAFPTVVSIIEDIFEKYDALTKNINLDSYKNTLERYDLINRLNKPQDEDDSGDNE